MSPKRLHFPMQHLPCAQHDHAPFWDQAVSRGGFIKATAGVSGAVLGADLWMPVLARADSPGGTPKPISSGDIGGDFRLFLPGPKSEPSTITDFNGVVGATEVTGTATDSSSGKTLFFDNDVRFMNGTYIDTNGRTSQGTFAEI